MPVRTRRASAIVVVLLAVLAGCGGGGGDDRAARTRVTAGPDVVTTVAAGPLVTREVSPVDGLFGVGDAQQVISVVADDYGQSTGYLTAYELRADGWHTVFGPWPAFVGENGFAPPNEKREGDGRTPTGAYGFDFAFGVLDDPGVKLPYRRVTSDAIVWDDDPASARYNLWTDVTEQDAGVDPEPMYNQPVYNYGAVIAFNPERVPGMGSAIFLHASKGNATAGCVSLPQDRVVELLRWLDPQRQPRIVMGTRAALAP